MPQFLWYKICCLSDLFRLLRTLMTEEVGAYYPSRQGTFSAA